MPIVISKDEVFELAQSRVKGMRVGMNMPQSELAGRLGISQPLLSRYETGSLRCPRDVVIAVFTLYYKHITAHHPNLPTSERVLSGYNNLKCMEPYRHTRKGIGIKKQGLMDTGMYYALVVGQMNYKNTEYLAKVLGLHVQTVYKVLSGKTKVGPNHLIPLFKRANRLDLIRFIADNRGRENFGSLLFRAYVDGDDAIAAAYTEATMKSASKYTINLDEYNI